jgi:phosphoglycolate phosphatase
VRRNHQSILSASKQDYLEDAVTGFNVRHMLTAVVGLDTHHASGKVEIAKSLVATINFDLSEIILLGDTVHDYEAAKAIGVDCCLIPSGHQDYQRLASCGTKMIASFSALNG